MVGAWFNDQDAIGFEAATGDLKNGVLALLNGEKFSFNIWAGCVGSEEARQKEQLALNSI